MPVVKAVKGSSLAIAQHGPGLQQIRAVPGAFGGAEGVGAVGGALSQIGEIAHRRAMELKAQEDEAAVTSAELALAGEIGEIQRQFGEMRGRNAFENKGAFVKKIEEAGERHGASLGNPSQQKAYQERMARRRMGAVDYIAGHSLGQFREWQKDLDQAQIEESLQASTAFAGVDPQSQLAHLEKGEAVLSARASREGWAPEVLKHEQEKFRSAAHAAAVQKFLATGNGGAARRYFKQNEGEIDADLRAKLDGATREGSNRAVAQAATDRIIEKGLSFSDALAEARKISDPEQRDEVVRRVKTRFSEMETARDLQQREDTQAAWQPILSGKGVDAIPADLWSRLSPEAQHKIKTYEDRRLDGTKTRTDPGVWFRLKQLQQKDPQKFAALDLYQHVNDLAWTDFKSLVEEQGKMSKEETYVTKIVSDKNMLDHAAKQMGIKGDNDKYYTFTRTFEQILQAFEKEHGRTATGKEKAEILDRILLEGEIEGSTWLNDPDVRVWEILGDPEKMKKFIVPEKDRAAIAEEYGKAAMRAKQQGKTMPPLDDGMVRRAYFMKNFQVDIGQ